MLFLSSKDLMGPISLSVAKVDQYSTKEQDLIDKFSLKSRIPSTVKPLSGGSAVKSLDCLFVVLPCVRVWVNSSCLKYSPLLDWYQFGESVEKW